MAEQFDEGQSKFAQECFKRWINLRKQSIPHDITSADIDHSALLKRLLSGKEPFPSPPPKAFSYPWYELFDNGFAMALEVNLSADHNWLTIEQDPAWIITNRHDNEYRVEYHPYGYKAHVYPSTARRTRLVDGVPEEYLLAAWRVDLKQAEQELRGKE